MREAEKSISCNEGDAISLTIVIDMKQEHRGKFELKKDLAQISKEVLSSHQRTGNNDGSLSNWKLTERHGRPLPFDQNLEDSGVMPRETLYLDQVKAPPIPNEDRKQLIPLINKFARKMKYGAMNKLGTLFLTAPPVKKEERKEKRSE